jgi:hypothetical protein
MRRAKRQRRRFFVAYFMHSLCIAPFGQRDSNQSVAIAHHIQHRIPNHAEMPLACPVGTNANRPLFMQLMEEIYTTPPQLRLGLHNPPRERYSLGSTIE